MTKLTGTDYRSHGMIDIEKRVSMLEAQEIDDLDLLKQITDLKRCISYLAEYVARHEGCSVAELIVDIGVLR